MHVYKWLDNAHAREKGDDEDLHSLPELETKDKWTLKTHPGVSTFGDRPKSVGPEHLDTLFEHALDIVPKDQVSETPIFLLATAGVRLLPEGSRQELLKEICSYTQSHTKFLLPDCDLHVQVIPGETEGLYGWIAANYLVGGFNDPETHAHGKGHHTYGFLDMGGASAQIAFAPNATEAEKHANDLKLLRLRTVDGTATEYRVFVTTWLGFGANEARRRYVDELLESVKSSPANEIPDPCLPTGLLMKTDGDIIPTSERKALENEHLIGTGKFDECLRRTFPLLGKDVPCEDDPCLLNGVHVPAIDFDVNHFIGISEFWHSTHEVFEMGNKEAAYDFNTYQHKVSDFCSKDWAEIQEGVSDHTWGKKVDEQTAYEICFKASWLINVLHDGIGIPRVGIENTQTGQNGTEDLLGGGKKKGYLDPFQAVNKIEKTEVSWTLGKMVLYASSQIPAEQEALPVGFGSNQAGIPPDFQYPSGGLIPIDGEKSTVEELRESLFDSDSPRRIPGFIIFLLIVCIASFFLCGRDRRNRALDKVFRGSGKRGFGKFFSRAGPSYERVMEDAADLEDPENFELRDMDSSDDDKAKPQAWGSPKSKRGRRGNSGSNADLPRSGTMSPKLLDRQGMAVRTDSLERLNSSIGRKSRTGSPNRLKSSASFLSSLRERE